MNAYVEHILIIIAGIIIGAVLGALMGHITGRDAVCGVEYVH